MFIAAIFLLGVLNVVYTQDSDTICDSDIVCYVKAFETCKINDTWVGVSESRPTTKEALENICPHVLKDQKCLKEYLETCNLEEEFDIRGYMVKVSLNPFFNMYAEICRNDSGIYSKFLSSATCVHNVLFEGELTETAVKKNIFLLRRRLERLLKDDESYTMMYEKCLRGLFHVNSSKDVIYKNCGTDGKDVAVLFYKYYLEELEEDCPMKIRIDILELLESLDLLTQDIWVKDMLRKPGYFYTC